MPMSNGESSTRSIGDAHSEAVDAVALWDRWVSELEDHPLDMFEYEAMLGCRDEVAECIEIAGPSRLWDLCDAIDVRFREVTVESDASPVRAQATSTGWWWLRLPASDDALRYLLSDY